MQQGQCSKPLACLFFLLPSAHLFARAHAQGTRTCVRKGWCGVYVTPRAGNAPHGRAAGHFWTLSPVGAGSPFEEAQAEIFAAQTAIRKILLGSSLQRAQTRSHPRPKQRAV